MWNVATDRDCRTNIWTYHLPHSLDTLKQGVRMPFLTVAHDGWDGKRKLIFGVTLFFIHLANLTIYRIPVGLTEPTGKNATVLAKTTMDIVERFGGEAADIFRSVSDNTNVAVATGRK